MRTLTIVLATGLLAGGGTASAKAIKDSITTPPQAVATAFTTRFPNAREVKWKEMNNDYMANFKVNHQKDVAYYTPEGKWKATETPVKWSWDLPPAVKNGWKKSNYAAWYILKIDKVVMPHNTEYCLDVNNTPLLDDNHVFNFETEYKIYFSPDGKLVREDLQP